MEKLERFPKGLIAEMRCIQNEAQPPGFAQQLAPALAEAAARIGSVRIDAGTVMRGTDRAANRQSGRPVGS